MERNDALTISAMVMMLAIGELIMVHVIRKQAQIVRKQTSDIQFLMVAMPRDTTSEVSDESG